MSRQPDAVDALAGLVDDARSGVAFTGAGVSTESGIPDFRSPTGIWTRQDPREYTFRRYVQSPDVRTRAWQNRYRLWALEGPEPNRAHRALADLEAAGRLAGVVTQNIDGLHQDAGSHAVVELHGTARRITCIGHRPRVGTPDGCGFEAPDAWAYARLEAGEADPACPACGGLLKTRAVSFGQNLWPGTLERARALLDGTDLVLVVGSSLQVQPAASLPAAARQAGAALAIVNAEPTPLDGSADVLVHRRAGPVLSAVAARVGAPRGPRPVHDPDPAPTRSQPA